MAMTKEERLLKSREYKLKHKEELKIKNKLYIEKNKEIRREKRKIYNEDNSDKIKKQAKEFREKNKEKIKKEYKKWYNDNIEYNKERTKKFKENNKEYFLSKKEEYKKYGQQYYLNNKEEYKKYSENYNIVNKETIIIKRNKYYNDNKEDINNRRKEIRKTIFYKDTRKKWRKNRIKNDPLFKLKNNISTNINHSFKSIGGKDGKCGRKTVDILCCSIVEFKKHIESKFEPWMNWSNHGNWNGYPTELNTAWDLDHIIPISSASTEEEVLKLNHYTNFQPLCSIINRHIKKNNI